MVKVLAVVFALVLIVGILACGEPKSDYEKATEKAREESYQRMYGMSEKAYLATERARPTPTATKTPTPTPVPQLREGEAIALVKRDTSAKVPGGGTWSARWVALEGYWEVSYTYSGFVTYVYQWRVWDAKEIVEYLGRTPR